MNSAMFYVLFDLNFQCCGEKISGKTVRQDCRRPTCCGGQSVLTIPQYKAAEPKRVVACEQGDPKDVRHVFRKWAKTARY